MNSLKSLIFILFITLAAITAQGDQGPDDHIRSPHTESITIGSGDNLGKACFSKYVAMARKRELKIRAAKNHVHKPAHAMRQLIARASNVTTLKHIVVQTRERIYLQLRHDA